MKKPLSTLVWFAVAALGAFAYMTLAVHRGEPLNSVYILIAALCTYTIGYRFYSKWIAASVLTLNDRRATPCEVHDDGKDFVKTNKWMNRGASIKQFPVRTSTCCFQSHGRSIHSSP